MSIFAQVLFGLKLLLDYQRISETKIIPLLNHLGKKVFLEIFGLNHKGERNRSLLLVKDSFSQKFIKMVNISFQKGL